MNLANEKQFIIFVDYEIMRPGNFGIYVIDRVNKVYFKIVTNYTVDCVKAIKELTKEYETQRIEMYTFSGNLQWAKSELEVSTKIPIELAHNVRNYRNQLRIEHNLIRNNTQPSYYYQYALGYEFISKEEYDNREYKREFLKVMHFDFNW